MKTFSKSVGVLTLVNTKLLELHFKDLKVMATFLVRCLATAPRRRACLQTQTPGNATQTELTAPYRTRF